MKPASATEVAESFLEEMAFLLEVVPVLHTLARPGEPLDSLPGWNEWQQKPRLSVEAGGAVLVAAIAGPTGAGKSSLFSLLTGIDAPRSLKRPTSYACAVGAPSRVIEAGVLERLFPGYHLQKLNDPDVLTHPGLPAEELFLGTVSREEEGAQVVFVDLPDFNAVDKSNWVKAERMLARAEIVVFVTYAEGYKDEVVVRHLCRACRIAGALVFLFNKVPEAENRPARDVARELWEDLLAFARTDPEFCQKRSDGTPLHEFLQKGSVFVAPRENALQLESIQPLNEGDASFLSAVGGQEAREVLVRNLAEITSEGIHSFRRLASEAREENKNLERRIETAREAIHEPVRKVAGGQFPIGRLVANIVAEARENPGIRLRRYVAMPSIVAGRVAGAAVGNLRRIVKKESDELKRSDEIEKEHLPEALEAIIDVWRQQFLGTEPEALTASRVRETMDDFFRKDLPTPGTEWDTFVRDEGRKWVKSHPWLAAAVATMGDLLLWGGLAAVAIDFAVAGGMGTVGVVSAAGAGSAMAGKAVDAFSKLGLKEQLEKADVAWRTQRTEELSAHVEAEFADPLFLGKWKERRRALEELSLPDIENACERLGRIQETLGKEPK